jgi:hypothetical protein
VPILPDDHFESYLKQFRPLPPEPARFKQRGFKKRGSTRWRAQPAAVWAAVAAVVIVALLTLYPRARQPRRPDDAVQWVGGAYTGNLQPLTIQSANAMLAHAPSFKAAVDAIAVPSNTTSFDGKQSALDVLSKDSKL